MIDPYDAVGLGNARDKAASVSEEELERMEAENRAASSWGASLATPVPGAVSNAMVERALDIDAFMEDVWAMARCSSPTDRRYFAGNLRDRLTDALSSLAPVEAVATEPVACSDCNGTGVENKPWMNGENCVPCKGTGYTTPTGDSGALREALAVIADGAKSAAAYWNGPSQRSFLQIEQTARAALKGEPGK
jgi:hypothetical protein